MSPCLFNLYVEYIVKNAGLEEAQVGIKIARKNINKLRYADDTTLMGESEEELKSLLMKVKEESEKVGLKIMASGPITSWEIEKQWQTLFFWAPKPLQMVIAAMKLKDTQRGDVTCSGSHRRKGTISGFEHRINYRPVNHYGRKQRTVEPLDESERRE